MLCMRIGHFTVDKRSRCGLGHSGILQTIARYCTESASARTIVARRSTTMISVPGGTSTACPPASAEMRPSGVRISVPLAEKASSIHTPVAVGPMRMCVRDSDRVVSGTMTDREPSTGAGLRPRTRGSSISSRYPESKMSHSS